MVFGGKKKKALHNCTPDVPSSKEQKAQTNLHLSTVWEVSRGYVVLQLDFGENNWQLVDQILLFIVFPEDRGHLLL